MKSRTYEADMLRETVLFDWGYARWIVGLLIVTQACQQHQPAAKHVALSAPTGIYVGLAEITGFPAEKPGDKWYHENYVYIRPDSLFMEGNPVVVHQDGEKSYSASDGGFYSFSGRIDTVGGKLVAKLRMFAQDYIAAPIIIRDKDTAATKNMNTEEAVRRGLAYRDSSFYKKTYPIYLTTTGFDMDGVHYAPTAPDTLLGLPGFPDAKRFFGKAPMLRP